MFKQRLREVRTEAKISQKDLANQLFISQQAYAKYELGTSSPSIETLNKLATILNVQVDYLLGNVNDPFGRLDNQAMLDDINSYETIDNIFPLQLKRIPLLGEIACGKPIMCNEERESYIMSGTSLNADFCLKAKGDSMKDARILDGDIVFIQETSIVDQGEIAVVIIDNEATLKRVYYYPEQAKLILNPANPAYEPLVFIGDELNDVKILGRAVAFQSDVR